MPVRQSRWGVRRLRLGQTVAILTAAVVGVTAQPVLAMAAPASATVDAQVYQEASAKGSATFMVYLREEAKLDSAAKVRDRGAKGAAVYRQLTDTADRTQAGLRSQLRAKKAAYTSFWIANALQVTGDKALIDSIAARKEVARIEPVKSYALIDPVSTKKAAKATQAGPEWGLTNIEAPRVWSEYGDRGERIVIASIDSGAQFDHSALVGKYRGNKGNGTFDHNYNWFDPSEVCPSAEPCDNTGHGTHTIGTMVGDDGAGNQTGVAPGATWISAKGCETKSCSNSALLAAGQWVLAPTDLNGENPRPDLRPDIVNNSWGGGGGNAWYEQTVAAWRAAGIFPAFAAGNTVPSADCGSVSSPSDYTSSYSVAAYDVNNVIGDFSNRGPTVDGRTKPNIGAPGVQVRSSVPGDSYEAWDGTSMATPHLSGAVALIWSVADSLRGDIAGTEALLNQTATDTSALDCGGTVVNNNIFGEGRLNVYEAVTAAPRGPVGKATGTVTDSATGAAVAGALVASGQRRVTTDADGRYALTLPAGEQAVTVTAYGYADQTVTLAITDGGSLTKNIALVATPPVTVTGKVTDGSGQGWPLYASIEIVGRPGAPVLTDPITGKYSFSIPGNSTYKLITTARYSGYQKVTSDLVLGAAAKTVNIPVPIDPGCTANGYAVRPSAPILSEKFDSGQTPAGWSVRDRTGGGSWAFDNPHKRGNFTGGSGGFAIVDSDHYGSEATQDSDLVTPPMDLTGVDFPHLRFNSDRWSGIFEVDSSIDGGTTWSTIVRYGTQRGPVLEELALTPVAGKANVQLRFRYRATYEWWWQVDNVEIINRVCAPVDGALVAGFTTDKNTGDPLNYVTVTSADKPTDKAVSAPTPDDPNIPDGFYWFYSTLTGAHPLTASKAPYQTLTKDTTVAANSVKRADFALKAGQIAVSTTAITSYQPYGSSRTAAVTVTNTGSAPAVVNVQRRPDTVDVASMKKGAPVIEQRVTGLTAENTATVPASAGANGTAGAAADDAWTELADLPSNIYDNAAVTLDGKVYSFGGATDSTNAKSARVYDPATQVWLPLPDLPTPRGKASAVAVDGKIYVIGGWSVNNGVVVNTVDVFDPTTRSWSTLSNRNPVPTAAAGTAVVNGQIYLVGGCLNGTCKQSDKTVVFDTTSGAFRTVASYPKPVTFIGCGGIGGGVYCAGGKSGDSSVTNTYSYDPAKDAWTALPDIPVDSWGAQAGAAGGLLVIAGGTVKNGTALTNRTLAYDPAARAWQDLPIFTVPAYRGGFACGAYKLGGLATSSDGSRIFEKLGGLPCDSEAAWVSATPSSFTLAPGASQKVSVTLTATTETGVAQPGTYRSQLALIADSPYRVPGVDVTANVSPPTSWGKVEGTVLGRTCAGEFRAVRATLRLESGTNGYSLVADGTGHYAYWLPKGKYQVIVAKDGWTPQVKQQQVTAGFVSTLDVTLAPLTSCESRLGGV
ncbi:S8 family serine peptidase [Micromonospora chokoriensis]|uniref:S8 family serine peptidase n=1 Tax=Micromonospora chokoriensis TaxID=356851 RepID=UPI0004C3985F